MKLAAAIIAILVVAGLVAFFLSRRNSDEGSETIDVDGVKFTIGPGVKMSGPEFLAMLEAQGVILTPTPKTFTLKFLIRLDR